MAPDSRPHRLAAIVALDIVGYSAFSERDPVGAAAQVERVRAAAEAAASSNGGRIFNTAGDGVMLEFPTGGAALKAALALTDSELGAMLRVGAHLGEVNSTEGGDLLGHGVNVAARLQAEASPGAMLVSQILRESAPSELSDRLTPRGKIRLAKMRETINVFSHARDGASVAARALQAPLLAVLAFDASTRDRPTRTLSDGVSEEILYAVSRTPGLRVIGATSSFAFRGRDKPRAAKTLNATHVLDGSVRRNGEQVRVSAHLTETESGVVIWAERYDRDIGDALTLQEEIAGEVVKALAVALNEAGRARAPKLTAALSDAYFEARELMRSGAVACIQSAAAALERIVREAPEFARAWAALATAKLEVLRLSRANRARLVEDAREAAERALGVDPSMAEAYAVLAALEGEYFSRWREREALLERALAIEPSNPLLLFRHGQFLVATGRVTEGYAQQRRGYELDPLDPMLAAFHGYNVWSTQSKSDGRQILDDAAARYPDNVFVWFMRLNTAALDGDFITAQALRKDGERLVPGLTDSAAHKAGQRTHELMMNPSPEAFMKLGEDFTAMAEAEPAAALDLAVALSVLGFTGPALSIFEDALDNVDAWRAGALEAARPHIGYETALLFIGETRALRTDPDFVKLCRRLGLARYWRDTGKWPDCAKETPYDFTAACADPLRT